MTQTEPTTLGDLWRMIERDSNLTRDQVRREIDDVKKRLDGFVSRDHFEAEKRLLEARIAHVEDALEELEREANATASSRHQSRRELIYKGVIPVLSLLVAAIAVYVSSGH
jgi:transposase